MRLVSDLILSLMLYYSLAGSEEKIEYWHTVRPDALTFAVTLFFHSMPITVKLTLNMQNDISKNCLLCKGI